MHSLFRLQVVITNKVTIKQENDCKFK